MLATRRVNEEETKESERYMTLILLVIDKRDYRSGLRHHADKLNEVDLSVTVQVEVLHHFVDFLFAEVLADTAHDLLEFGSGYLAVSVFVEYLERLFEHVLVVLFVESATSGICYLAISAKNYWKSMVPLLSESTSLMSSFSSCRVELKPNFCMTLPNSYLKTLVLRL